MNLVKIQVMEAILQAIGKKISRNQFQSKSKKRMRNCTFIKSKRKIKAKIKMMLSNLQKSFLFIKINKTQTLKTLTTIITNLNIHHFCKIINKIATYRIMIIIKNNNKLFKIMATYNKLVEIKIYRIHKQIEVILIKERIIINFKYHPPNTV